MYPPELQIGIDAINDVRRGMDLFCDACAKATGAFDQLSAVTERLRVEYEMTLTLHERSLYERHRSHGDGWLDAASKVRSRR